MERRKPAPLAQRTATLLRQLGYMVAKVEHWNTFTHHREDLFGVLDLLAVSPGRPGVLGVQVCAMSGLADHRAKVLAAVVDGYPFLNAWNTAGNRLWLFGWHRVTVGKRHLWRPTVEVVTTTAMPVNDPDLGYCVNGRHNPLTPGHPLTQLMAPATPKILRTPRTWHPDDTQPQEPTP